MAGMTPDAGGGFGGAGQSNAAFKKQLNKVYAWYTGGFVLHSLWSVAILEQMGMGRSNDRLRILGRNRIALRWYRRNESYQ
jgi:cation/acetate symporter